MSMLSVHDPRWGGFGTSPKFPQSMSLDHLLRQHHRTGSDAALRAVITSLDAMAAGGIHDHIGGGFSRYSVDERWLVPHFEKMLYDNALLVRTYLHAWQITGEERHLQVVEETIGYVLRDLTRPGGGHWSAEDADSVPAPPPGRAPLDSEVHAEEGAFYVWQPSEVARVLDDAGLVEHLTEVLQWYGIVEGGNFEGASIPNRLHARGQLARPPHIEAARRALLHDREFRPRPGLDDKVLTEWNALMVAAVAEAAAATGRADWLASAVETAEFLCDHLRAEPDADGRRRWLRSWQADLDDGAGGARHLGLRLGPRRADRRLHHALRGDRHAALAARGHSYRRGTAGALLGPGRQRVEHRRRRRAAGHPPQGPDRRRDALGEQPGGGRPAAARGPHRGVPLRRARPSHPPHTRPAGRTAPARVRQPAVGDRAAGGRHHRGGRHRRPRRSRRDRAAAVRTARGARRR